jgi:hypothetical protein
MSGEASCRIRLTSWGWVGGKSAVGGELFFYILPHNVYSISRIAPKFGKQVVGTDTQAFQRRNRSGKTGLGKSYKDYFSDTEIRT